MLDPFRHAISNAKDANRPVIEFTVECVEAIVAEIERLQLGAGNIKQVFVVALHFGCEGHTAPFQAFLSKTDADAARKLFDGGGHSDANFYAVPVWPEHAVRWMDQKPIDREEA